MNEAEVEAMHQSQMEDAAFEMEAALALGRMHERVDITCSLMSGCQRKAIIQAFVALQDAAKQYDCDDCSNAVSRLMANFKPIINGGDLL